jgi:hypothetical protein
MTPTARPEREKRGTTRAIAINFVKSERPISRTAEVWNRDEAWWSATVKHRSTRAGGTHELGEFAVDRAHVLGKTLDDAALRG